jgi:hypothetical protein
MARLRLLTALAELRRGSFRVSLRSKRRMVGETVIRLNRWPVSSLRSSHPSQIYPNRSCCSRRALFACLHDTTCTLQAPAISPQTHSQHGIT